MSEQQKPIVTKRWNIISLQDAVDRALERNDPAVKLDFSKPEDVERFRAMLLRLSEHILFHVGMAYEKAAARGIEEATRLICDPDYYETVKRRRATQERRSRNWQEEQKAESRRRRFNPTPEERAADVREAYRSLDYHQRCIERINERLLELEEPETEAVN